MPEGKRCDPCWNDFDFRLFLAKASKIGSNQAAKGLRMIVEEYKEMKGAKTIQKILDDKKMKNERENKQKSE